MIKVNLDMMLLTPFRTDNNENVLINRGWINKELKIILSINPDTKLTKK